MEEIERETVNRRRTEFYNFMQASVKKGGSDVFKYIRHKDQEPNMRGLQQQFYLQVQEVLAQIGSVPFVMGGDFGRANGPKFVSVPVQKKMIAKVHLPKSVDHWHRIGSVLAKISKYEEGTSKYNEMVSRVQQILPRDDA